jgi:hypothetical protein
VRLSLIIFLVCCDFFCISGEPQPVHAQTAVRNFELTQDQSFSKQIDIFLHSLSKAPEDECVKIFGRYAEIIEGELNSNKLYFVSYKAVKNLLDQAATESIDSLTLFTHPLLQDQKGLAIVFDKELLRQISEHFDFHGIFSISAPSVDEGSAVKMTFFVIGQGKFIVGYDRNAKILNPDYDFVTGNYDYNELFVMDAKKDSKGNLGLFNIKGVSNPNGKPRWMKGPLNADIHSLILTTDPGGRPKICVQYDLWGIRNMLLKPIPIEKL